jgi:hypothetical protein
MGNACLSITLALSIGILAAPPAGAAEAPVDSSAAAAPSAALAPTPKIGPHDLLRVSGGFGRFQGYAHTADQAGLSRLSAFHEAPADWRLEPLPEHIQWSAIDQVQVHKGSPGRGALIGAAAFGVLGGWLAYALNNSFTDDSPSASSNAGAIAKGFTVSALVGAAIGAGVGAASRHWVVVYHRR